MTTRILAAGASSLREAFYELSLERRVPDADLLDDVVRRYPQYAEELTEFAIDLALDALHDAATVGTAESYTHEDLLIVPPAVSRAISRFHNRLYAINRRDSGLPEEQSVTASRRAPVNPFEALSQGEFRDLRSRLDVSTVFIAKLRDRQIDPNTIPNGFSQRVADELDEPIGVVVEHFAGLQISTGRQFYKADEKPSSTKQQSFREAVRNSGLSEVQQQQLMDL